MTTRKPGDTAVARDATLRLDCLRVARVARHMLARLDEPHTLASLAERAHLSPFHFLRRFRELAGETPEAFLRRLRLQRAAWQLATSPDQGVTEIALAAGFGSHDGFGRAFRSTYGVTPSEFRRRGGDPWAACPHTVAFWRPAHPLRPRTEETPAMVEYELRDMPPLVYAAVRSVGPYNTVGPAFRRIVGWAIREGLMGAETKVVGLCRDDTATTPEARLRYDAAVTLPDGRAVPTPEDVRVAALPACTWAVARHRGSYATLPGTFGALAAALVARPDLIRVPLCGLEIYVNDPERTPTEDLLTEVCLPVVQLGDDTGR